MTNQGFLNRWLIGLFILVAFGVVPVPPAFSAPANPKPFVLEQPDGTRFRARFFGDEWGNGTETLDGYTIIKDKATGYWKYAAKIPHGELFPSPYTVGKDLPGALPPKLRAEPPAESLVGLSEVESPPVSALTLGSRPTLVLLVQFLNKTARTTAASWSAKFFGPSSSVRDYYNASSYGQFTPTAASESHGTANDGIVGWLTLNYKHPNTGGNIGDANKQITRDALIAANPYVNFSAYDTNGDKDISPNELLIVVVVAGNEASFYSACSPNVWGHVWSIFGNVTAPTLDGVTVGGTGYDGHFGYAQFGEMHCATSSPPGQIATIGIMVHEMGHLLGLPDLYDTDGSSEGIGNWSVMAGGVWNRVTRSGDSPALMDPWSKYFLGWVTPTPVSGSLTNQSIPASATNATIYQFLTGSPSAGGEYFLLENRQKIGYDTGLPGAGLLLWHIDESQTTNENECIPGGSPACNAATHYKVAVLQADNAFNLERNQNRGDGGDPFPGTAINRSFTDSTSPNSKLYTSAYSGVSVTTISDSTTTMTATLSTPSITVAVPNGGETWAVGSTQVTRWTYTENPGSAVKIELLKGGVVTATLTSSTSIGSGGGGSYSWTIPSTQTLGNDYRVRVTSTSDSSFTDTSNGNFTIITKCGNGAVDSGEQCDLGTNNGKAGVCCSATCQFQSAATVCRAAARACDVAESCTGTSASCSANTLKASTTVCRAAAGVCDMAESCTGTTAYCPTDTYKASTTVCRAAAGTCDVAESCTGTSAYCPANSLQSAGTVCRAAVGACDIAEACSGTSSSCPANGFQPNGTTCDDGNTATCNDQCTAGSCAGTSC